MDTIYLIEKTWIDNLENRNAWGYSPVGFVKTKKEAEEIVEKGGRHKEKDCWEMDVMFRVSIAKDYPTKYRYKEITRMEKL